MTRPTALLLASALSLAAHGSRRRAACGRAWRHWEGAIEVPGQALAIEVDLAAKDGTVDGHHHDPRAEPQGLPVVRHHGHRHRRRVRHERRAGRAALCGHAVGRRQGDRRRLQPGWGDDRASTLAWKGDAKIRGAAKSTAITKDLEGSWEGALDVQGTVLRLVLKLTNQPGGATGCW